MLGDKITIVIYIYIGYNNNNMTLDILLDIITISTYGAVTVVISISNPNCTHSCCGLSSSPIDKQYNILIY